MTKYLDVFNKYCDLLDEEFDDSLIIELFVCIRKIRVY